MGLFSRFFNKPKTNDKKETDDTKNVILSFIDQYNGLLNEDKYLSRSEFSSLKKQYKETYDRINVLVSTDSINKYCKDNSISLELVTEFMSK